MQMLSHRQDFKIDEICGERIREPEHHVVGTGVALKVAAIILASQCHNFPVAVGATYGSPGLFGAIDTKSIAT